MQTALNQQTNMMLEVQNFDQQPQHVSTEASSSRQQAPLADILAHNPQPVRVSLMACAYVRFLASAALMTCDALAHACCTMHPSKPSHADSTSFV